MSLLEDLKKVIKKYEEPKKYEYTYVGFMDMTADLFDEGYGSGKSCHIDLVVLPFGWKKVIKEHGAYVSPVSEWTGDVYGPLYGVETPHGTIGTVFFWPTPGNRIVKYKEME